MYADSTIIDDGEDDDLIDPDANSTRPLIDYTLVHHEDISA